MKVSREKKKEEAIRRMKKLNIFDDAVKQFIKSDTVMSSEPPFGALFWLTDDQKKLVREFEEKYNALVYIVVRSYTEFGTHDSFLYVSDYEEEWGTDNEDIKEGYALTYTHNYDAPEFSEFGSIGITERAGGLIRTA